MERPGLVRFFTQRNTALIILFLVSWVVALDLLWYIPTRQSLERSASELSLQVQASASATVRATLESNLVPPRTSLTILRVHRPRWNTLCGVIRSFDT